jgi:hypothetical protein
VHRSFRWTERKFSNSLGISPEVSQPVGVEGELVAQLAERLLPEAPYRGLHSDEGFNVNGLTGFRFYGLWFNRVQGYALLFNRVQGLLSEASDRGLDSVVDLRV